MNVDTMSGARSATGEANAWALLNALPHPVILVEADDHIGEANIAAEAFFQASASVIKRHLLEDFIPFGSPLLSLIDQVRERGAAVNEYRVDIGTPRNGTERVVDIYASPASDGSRGVVLLLQERTMTDKIDRQLTHRGAARSVTGLATMPESSVAGRDRAQAPSARPGRRQRPDCGRVSFSRPRSAR